MTTPPSPPAAAALAASAKDALSAEALAARLEERHAELRDTCDDGYDLAVAEEIRQAAAHIRALTAALAQAEERAARLHTHANATMKRLEEQLSARDEALKVARKGLGPFAGWKRGNKGAYVSEEQGMEDGLAIELRFVVLDRTHTPPAIPRLQYRWNYLAEIEPGVWDGRWVEWRDVPVVLESVANATPSPDAAPETGTTEE